jgi:putative DNA primase/helicase
VRYCSEINAVHELAKESLQYIVEMLLPREKDKEQRFRLLALAHKFDSIKRVRQMFDYARTDKRVASSIEQYDQDHWLLNCQNGTLDLRTGALLVPQRDHMQTKILPIEYDIHAAASVWAAFLERIMRSHAEVIPFLQRAIGYSLTGSNREHKFFVLHGSGRNGKSTFVETILAMLGDYAQSSNPETWLRQAGGRGAEPDIARLPGIRFVSTAEIGEGRALDEARVKAIVAGDRITTRQLYQPAFDFAPIAKLWISTNHAPKIRGNDEGMWRRVCLIPFDETIGYDEMDRDLPRKLREELPGILAWAVRGCTEWLKRGLEEPDVVRRRTSEYRTDQDILGQFLSECCIEDPDSRVRAADLYQHYVNWAQQQGYRHPLTANAFGRRLGDRGFESAKPGGAAIRIGLRLQSTAHDGSDECDPFS